MKPLAQNMILIIQLADESQYSPGPVIFNGWRARHCMSNRIGLAGSRRVLIEFGLTNSPSADGGESTAQLTRPHWKLFRRVKPPSRR